MKTEAECLEVIHTWRKTHYGFFVEITCDLLTLVELSKHEYDLAWRPLPESIPLAKFAGAHLVALNRAAKWCEAQMASYTRGAEPCHHWRKSAR